MEILIGEIIGTAILILLGNGVVANVVLNKSKGNSSGWIVITFGWAIAVFVAVYCSARFSGAHLNPAVTLSLLMLGKISTGNTIFYLLGQFLGAFLGSTLVWLQYRPHYDETEDKGGILATFCTAPAIRNPVSNFISEFIGTFVLIFGILMIASPSSTLGSLDALPVALLVLGIGLSLGGSTGYAINPARDLAPRIAHFLLPIKNKGNSDWQYAWIPVVAPLTGSIFATLLYIMISK